MKKKLFTMLLLATVQSTSSQTRTQQFQLLDLPYPKDALEPVISRQTLELHHGKHLQTYVNNVNRLIAGTQWEGKSIEEIVAQSDGALYNNAGQMLNHDLYFTAFSPQGGDDPTGTLLAAIEKEWGSVEAFKEEFTKQATALFGSGWTWLAMSADRKLVIKNYPNGGNPLKDQLTPLLGFDVWEHAYYLDYQNRRAEHIQKLWDIVDWKVVQERFE
jgi:Fe-Mn family superoxide dismutase